MILRDLVEKLRNSRSTQSSDTSIQHSQSSIKYSSDARIVSANEERRAIRADRAVWTVRSTVLACMISFEIFRIQQGWTFWDSYPVYAAVVPVITMFGLYARLK